MLFEPLLWWDKVLGFMAAGGHVLWWVAAALALMWALLIERYWFLLREFPRQRQQLIAAWLARTDTSSWYAKHIRQAWLAQASASLGARLSLIKTLIALCPLLGLLGTVTGMIQVFEVMALQGSGNPRLMASGISMATIPTMAGMVAAISGVFFSARLEARVRRARAQLADSLPRH